MGRNSKSVEYWVSDVDQHGDIVDYLYQGPHKNAALKVARQARESGDVTDVIEVERVTRWGNEDDGVVDIKFEFVKEG